MSKHHATHLNILNMELGIGMFCLKVTSSAQLLPRISSEFLDSYQRQTVEQHFDMHQRWLEDTFQYLDPHVFENETENNIKAAITARARRRGMYNMRNVNRDE